MVHPPQKKIVSYPLSISSTAKKGGGGLGRILNSERENNEWKWSRWNKSWANIWSKFDVELPWTISNPSIKVFFYTGCVRHGEVLNWKGLKVYNVRSPLDISTKLGLWLPRTLFGRPSTSEKCVISIFYSIELRGKGGGARSNFYCE